MFLGKNNRSPQYALGVRTLDAPEMWQGLRSRRRLLFLLLLGPLLCGLMIELFHMQDWPVIGQPLRLIFSAEASVIVFCAVWGWAWLVACYQYFRWPCPACGEPFQGEVFRLHSFWPRRSCYHCATEMRGGPI